MKTSLTAYGWGLAVVLSWGGCDREPPVALPQCRDGQGLGTDTVGNFQCTTLPPAGLTVPPPIAGCSPGQPLAYREGVTALSCLKSSLGLNGQPEGALLRAHITELAQKLDSLSQSVAQLDPTTVVYEPRYVGSTTVTATGRITAAGKVGLLAANALCSAQFGTGAHMCTQFQLTRTVAIGKLGPKDRIAPAWIYMPTWHNPSGSLTEPRSGLADNCGGYTTDDDTVGWTGMAVEWSPLDSGDVVFRWHGGSEARCSVKLPIACCSGGR